MFFSLFDAYRAERNRTIRPQPTVSGSASGDVIASLRDLRFGMLADVSAYSSDQDLLVADVTGNGVEVDVATNLLNGRIRLSLLWTQEIYLTPDDAEQAAHALLPAAERGRGPGRVSA
ncbi:hypothetical protein [Streptomyces sp. NRRL F-5122]|uniref:hypothetical protein n=1 Tax=Streptomyces sp. NRRL F-5122 TaxID=1609098 RepID=UPI000A6206D6|nr:hypothetical protein [Streptomyces sp. NRRL F-5122]